MKATVERYNPARLESALLAFWQRQMTEFDLAGQTGRKVSVTLPEFPTASPWWRRWLPPRRRQKVRSPSVPPSDAAFARMK
jgi:hypothetical protein